MKDGLFFSKKKQSIQKQSVDNYRFKIADIFKNIKKAFKP